MYNIMKNFVSLLIISLLCVLIKSEDEINECLGQPPGHLINSEANCSAFYVCVNNVPILSQCDPGYYFSVEHGECRSAEEVDCEDIEFCPEEGLHRLMMQNNCTEYIMCVYGVAYPRYCISGLHFDSILLECNLPDVVNCRRELCAETSRITFVASPDNCNDYYLCLNGMLRDEQFSCPKGTLFNSDRETCDIPDNFICVHDEDEDGEGEPLPEEQLCPDNGISSHRIYGSCSKFYRCVNGVKEEGDCQTLYFDLESDTCIFPCAANCEFSTIIPCL